MQIIDLLIPERVQVGVTVRSKKRLLEAAAKVLADDEGELEARAVYSCLCDREKIGATGLGYGVAIPHGRMAEADTAVGAFLQLREPIEFDSPDLKPVDLVFAMVVPETFHDEYLVLLAQLAEMFDDVSQRQKLRDADDVGEILAMIESWQK